LQTLHHQNFDPVIYKLKWSDFYPQLGYLKSWKGEKSWFCLKPDNGKLWLVLI
jgi:hypothetical protein